MALDALHRLSKALCLPMHMIGFGMMRVEYYDHALRTVWAVKAPEVSGILGSYCDVVQVLVNHAEIPLIQRFQLFHIKHRQPPYHIRLLPQPHTSPAQL